jgi:hypothetical protein
MITLISTILGFLGSMLPQGIKLYQDIKDKEHELKVMELQMQFSAQLADQRMNEIAIQADVTQNAAIYKTFYSGVSWVDALNGLVRPIITFSFFALYVFIKYNQYTYTANMDFSVIYNTLWAAEDQALFSSIIAFYFGNRVFDKVLDRRK